MHCNWKSHEAICKFAQEYSSYRMAGVAGLEEGYSVFVVFTQKSRKIEISVLFVYVIVQCWRIVSIRENQLQKLILKHYSPTKLLM